MIIWVQNRSRTQVPNTSDRICVNPVPDTLHALESRVFELQFFPWNLRSTYIFSLQKFFFGVRGATGRAKIKIFHLEILTRIHARDRCLDRRTRTFQASRTSPYDYFWRWVDLKLIGTMFGGSDLDFVDWEFWKIVSTERRFIILFGNTIESQIQFRKSHNLDLINWQSNQFNWEDSLFLNISAAHTNPNDF